jgi:hypothetical protein
MIRRRLVSAAIHVGLFVGFGACNYLVMVQLAAARSERSRPTCLGPSDAQRRIVYLHGLDSHAPSWQELDNRRALTEIPDATIAIPRAPACGSGRCWADDDSRTSTTIEAIRSASRTCFGDRPLHGVIGFSRGGFALARVARCDTIGARWAIVAGAFGHADVQRLDGCAVGVVIGNGDRYHHAGAIDYARRRRDASLTTTTVPFDGGHRLDAAALSSAIEELERARSRP